MKWQFPFNPLQFLGLKKTLTGDTPLTEIHKAGLELQDSVVVGAQFNVEGASLTATVKDNILQVSGEIKGVELDDGDASPETVDVITDISFGKVEVVGTTIKITPVVTRRKLVKVGKTWNRLDDPVEEEMAPFEIGGILRDAVVSARAVGNALQFNKVKVWIPGDGSSDLAEPDVINGQSCE